MANFGGTLTKFGVIAILAFFIVPNLWDLILSNPLSIVFIGVILAIWLMGGKR